MKTLRVSRCPSHPSRNARGIYSWLIPAMALWLMTPARGLSQNPVQRNQQAMTILGRTITAGGGQKLLTSIHDLVETGTITCYWADQEEKGSVMVKSRGARQVRIDADLPEGRRRTIVNHGSGSLIEATGRKTPIPAQSAADLGGMTIPYLLLLAAIEEPTTQIDYLGVVTHNGASVHDIRVEQVYTPQRDPTGAQSARDAHDIFIDPDTFLVIAISDQIHFHRIGAEGIPHEIQYSNYKQEMGSVIPLTISETVRGVTGMTIQLSQVNFNQGLTDSDFDQ